VFHDLAQQPGLTVYHAAHLIELDADEIRLMHSLRMLNGPGGSVEVSNDDVNGDTIAITEMRQALINVQRSLEEEMRTVGIR
jgi:hypothetical protein